MSARKVTNNEPITDDSDTLGACQAQADTLVELGIQRLTTGAYSLDALISHYLAAASLAGYLGALVTLHPAMTSALHAELMAIAKARRDDGEHEARALLGELTASGRPAN